jgi:hypothetical protein
MEVVEPIMHSLRVILPHVDVVEGVTTVIVDLDVVYTLILAIFSDVQIVSSNLKYLI